MTGTNIVTRFAPSPTGNLHVGGARTALYAWAFARRHGGTFLLRMEDTDLARSSEAAAAGIIRDLKWLGLDWDNGEDIPRQSQRLDRYNAVIQQLLDAGKAYEQDGAVRFRGGLAVAFDDAVFGHIAVPAADFEDFVIRKGEAGGFFPTFHLAVVVDDIDFGVTHVIRGAEHLSNTAKHAAIYDALGHARPVWAHTPSIMNPDGSKMSKRDKAKVARAAAKDAKLPPISVVAPQRLADFMEKKNDDLDVALAIAGKLNLALPEIDVQDFERSGYLPEVLLNYLPLLGWNPGNDVERFDRTFLTESFSLERINKANSKFDREKLLRFNFDTILAMPAEAFASRLRSHFERYHPAFVQKFGAQFDLFASMYQARSQTLGSPAEMGRFFVCDDSAITYDDKAVKKNLTKNDGEGLSLLGDFRKRLAATADWRPETLHALIEAYTAELGLKNMGAIAQPLRVALTGTAVSPPIDQTLALIGKDVTLRRIDRCLDHCSQSIGG